MALELPFVSLSPHTPDLTKRKVKSDVMAYRGVHRSSYFWGGLRNFGRPPWRLMVVFAGDTWHLNLEDAKHPANFEFHGMITSWIPIPPQVKKKPIQIESRAR